jgi:hypothetical protein
MELCLAGDSARRYEIATAKFGTIGSDRIDLAARINASAESFDCPTA